MPELKNTFTGGKMEKDLDERIVPSGQYREALNISVSTSEASDVGAAQNILGNIKVTEAIAGPKKDYASCVINSNSNNPNRYYGTNKHITHVVDPQSDKLYRFIATTPTLGEEGNNHGVWMDRIVEYDTNAKIETGWQEKEKAVMVDVYKVETVITSLDIISPPPPPPDPDVTKYGCYEGACVDCGFSTCIGQTWNNDPTCGGGCSGTPALAIGDTHQGGIIFYLDGNGGGLIAAPSDQSSTAPWGCQGTDILGADSIAIGTGGQNTIDILNGCTEAGIAAKICDDLTIGEYSDWFLPSKDELNLMYLNIGQGAPVNIGSFNNSSYRSSTESDANNAWTQQFSTGNQYPSSKSNPPRVRAIRAF